MKTIEEIIVEKFKWTYDSDSGRFQLFEQLIKPVAIEFAQAYHEEKTRWISVKDNSMPKFYEHYLIKLNGTVQHIAYKFVGKEVDEHWIQDDSDPAYWFQADIGNEIYQIEITDTVLYRQLD